MKARARPSARCRKLLLELSRYLDGDLTPARRRTIERHIGACAADRIRALIAHTAPEPGKKRRAPLS